MGSGVVIVAYEAPVQLEQVRFYLVRLVERFDLALCGGSAFTSGDMLNPKLAAAPVKL